MSDLPSRDLMGELTDHWEGRDGPAERIVEAYVSGRLVDIEDIDRMALRTWLWEFTTGDKPENMTDDDKTDYWFHAEAALDAALGGPDE